MQDDDPAVHAADLPDVLVALAVAEGVAAHLALVAGAGQARGAASTTSRTTSRCPARAPRRRAPRAGGVAVDDVAGPAAAQRGAVGLPPAGRDRARRAGVHAVVDGGAEDRPARRRARARPADRGVRGAGAQHVALRVDGERGADQAGADEEAAPRGAPGQPAGDGVDGALGQRRRQRRGADLAVAPARPGRARVAVIGCLRTVVRASSAATRAAPAARRLWLPSTACRQNGTAVDGEEPLRAAVPELRALQDRGARSPTGAAPAAPARRTARVPASSGSYSNSDDEDVVGTERLDDAAAEVAALGRQRHGRGVQQQVAAAARARSAAACAAAPPSPAGSVDDDAGVLEPHSAPPASSTAPPAASAATVARGARSRPCLRAAPASRAQLRRGVSTRRSEQRRQGAGRAEDERRRAGPASGRLGEQRERRARRRWRRWSRRDDAEPELVAEARRRRPSRGSGSSQSSSTWRRPTGSRPRRRSAAAASRQASPASSSTGQRAAAAHRRAPEHEPGRGAAERAAERVGRHRHGPAVAPAPLTERGDARQHRLTSRAPGGAARGRRATATRSSPRPGRRSEPAAAARCREARTPPAGASSACAWPMSVATAGQVAAEPSPTTRPVPST